MDTFSGLIITEPDSNAVPGKIVVEDGKIVALIPLTTVEEKYYILPGFIDSHTHPIENGLNLLYPDLSSASSISQVLELVAAGLMQMPDAPVLFSFNLEPERLKERRYPYRRELDRLSNKKPIFLYRIDGHSGVANYRALDYLGEKVPAGVELDGAGNPTGVVRAEAYETLSANLKKLIPPEIIQEAIKLTGQQALRNGITTLGAMAGSDELTEKEWTVLFDALSATPIRMVPYFQTWRVEIAKKFQLPRIGGCLLLDGSFGSHTAALLECYSDAPGYHGVLYHQDSELIQFISRANELGLQTAFHAIGDRAIEQIIRCHREAKSDKHLRHRIEHAELLTPELIKQIAELKLILAVQPVFEQLWGGVEKMYAERLGGRWMRTNPYRALLDHGVILAGGSDAPVTPLDPIGGIRAAMNLPNIQQRISGREAVAIFTIHAAYSLGMENIIGKLAPKMEADFVFLDADPREDRDCHILATYVRGRPMFKSQNLL